MYNNDLNHFEKSVYIDIVEEFAERVEILTD